MAKGKPRDLAKEAAWRRRLSRQARSGQSVRAWCRRHGVKETAFHWWRRRLARCDAEQSAAAWLDAEQASSLRRENPALGPTLVPVHLVDESERFGEGQIEIELTDGRRIRVTGTVNREMLTQVLDVLERRAC